MFNYNTFTFLIYKIFFTIYNIQFICIVQIITAHVFYW